MNDKLSQSQVNIQFLVSEGSGEGARYRRESSEAWSHEPLSGHNNIEYSGFFASPSSGDDK